MADASSDLDSVRGMLAGLRPLLSTAALSGSRGPVSSIGRIRDLLYLKVSEEVLLVVSADSNASVGDKPSDTLAFSPEATGLSVTQVALMELLAVGARPIIIVDNLCVEMNPTGRRILAGVQEAADLLTEPVVITGSDETNMPTVQTGVGVTAIAVVSPEELLVGRCRAGDLVVVVGVPVGGPTHRYDEHEARRFASVATVDAIVRSSVAHEILPVGSHGVGYELAELARVAGLDARIVHPTTVALENSGGASTCVLVALDPRDLPRLLEVVDRPVHILATLTACTGAPAETP